MKQKLTILTILMMMLAMPQSVFAYDFSAVAPTGQTLYYNITGGSTVEVTSALTGSPYYYTKPSGALIIPETVTNSYGAEYSVTGIGLYAFYQCDALTSVTIPEGVTSIGWSAFYWCDGLTSITLPNSLLSIGNYAFFACRGLTSVILPEGLTTIGENAFAGSSGLTSLFIPDGVTSVGNFAFDRVKHIEYYGNLSGDLWGELSRNGVTDENFAYADEAKTTILAYIGTSGIVVVPSTVTSIGNCAFEGCFRLTNVIIPTGVTSLGESAFFYCPNLTSIVLPDSITSIGHYTFQSCTGLSSITLPQNLQSIGASAFENCRSLTEIVSRAS